MSTYGAQWAGLAFNTPRDVVNWTGVGVFGLMTAVSGVWWLISKSSKLRESKNEFLMDCVNILNQAILTIGFFLQAANIGVTYLVDGTADVHLYWLRWIVLGVTFTIATFDFFTIMRAPFWLMVQHTCLVVGWLGSAFLMTYYGDHPLRWVLFAVSSAFGTWAVIYLLNHWYGAGVKFAPTPISSTAHVGIIVLLAITKLLLQLNLLLGQAGTRSFNAETELSVHLVVVFMQFIIYPVWVEFKQPDLSKGK